MARRLEENGIGYMITGSVASSLQGMPRQTHDIDVVVSNSAAEAGAAAATLKGAFPEPDFYLDESAVREAIVERGMFNPTDVREGDKVDFWAAMLGGSDKQYGDSLRVYEVQHGQLDEAYLEQWTDTLGVADALRRLRAEAEPIE